MTCDWKADGVLSNRAAVGTRPRVWLGALALALALGLMQVTASRPVAASGYHPRFDWAVQEASWIVLHEVVSRHKPADVLRDLPADAQGVVFEVRVKRCFRGPFKPGNRLLIWDWNDRSSAGYYLSTKRPNLSFLAPPGTVRRRGPTARARTTLGEKARPKNNQIKLGLVFRNKSDTPSRGRGHGIKAWVQLLDQTRVGSRALDLRQVRQILKQGSDPVLVAYALTHWPGTLLATDAAVIRALISKHVSDTRVTTDAFALLRKQGQPLGTKALRALLTKGTAAARGWLLGQITKAEVATLRDLIWGWIAGDDPSALQAIRMLGRHQRAYLEKRLRAHRLPFWLNIPALKAIGKGPADLGQPPYPSGAMKANGYELVDVRKLLKGETFGIAYALIERKKGLGPLLQLLVPHLAKMRHEARELAIGGLRTHGYEVTPMGALFKVSGKPKPLPLAITLLPVVGQPHKLLLLERALRPTLLCARGPLRIHLQAPDGRAASRDATGGAFAKTRPAAPKGCFKRATGEVRRTEVDLSSLVSHPKDLEKFNRIQVAVVHPHRGAEHGLNAWTGLVFSASTPLQRPAKAATANLGTPKVATKTGSKGRTASVPSKPAPSNPRGCGCTSFTTGESWPRGALPLLWVMLALGIRRRSRGVARNRESRD